MSCIFNTTLQFEASGYITGGKKPVKLFSCHRSVGFLFPKLLVHKAHIFIASAIIAVLQAKHGYPRPDHHIMLRMNSNGNGLRHFRYAYL